MLFNELVAHGRNSGDNMATRFSDAMESRESSLGLFRDGRYLHRAQRLLASARRPRAGLQRPRARARHRHARRAVRRTRRSRRPTDASAGAGDVLRCVKRSRRQVIDTVRDGGVIFSYYPDPAWLKTSKFLNCRVHKTRPTPSRRSHEITSSDELGSNSVPSRVSDPEPAHRACSSCADTESRSAASRSSAFATRAISVSASAVLLLLDRFTHTGHRLHRVAGVEARRIQQSAGTTAASADPRRR